ncbi:MAG: radical SAM protein, partial [bacterium]
MLKNSNKSVFQFILIKPSHYDDEGYVIQWLRSAVPSNTLAALNGLALDCAGRGVLGEGVDLVVSSYDESNTRIRPDKIAKKIKKSGGKSLVALVGVQSNQFPRAVDISRELRGMGIQVCIGGFHVSGCLSMLPEIPVDLQEAMDLGISLFAGEVDERLDEVLKDALLGKLKPLYNYLDDLPALEGAPTPILPSDLIKRTGGAMSSFDAGRGCPFQCSFCTIINVQGRKSRWRGADDVERIVRANMAQGVSSFFITDDNFARNVEWEPILDRLIELREEEGLKVKLTIQVDTLCHKIEGFIEKCGRAGVKRVFIGLE